MVLYNEMCYDESEIIQRRRHTDGYSKVRPLPDGQCQVFPDGESRFLRERLSALEDDRFNMLAMVELKDPIMMLIISLLFGTLGIDRFLLGDIGMGVLKLLTGGLCGILTLVDWFLIMNKTKELNFNKVMALL